MAKDNADAEGRERSDENIVSKSGRRETRVVDANAWTGQQRPSRSVQHYQPQKPSEAVLEAVAEWHGVSKLELDTPLYEYIDPEALDRFLASSNGTVEFDYLGTTVRVDHEWNVSLSSQGFD